MEAGTVPSKRGAEGKKNEKVNARKECCCAGHRCGISTRQAAGEDDDREGQCPENTVRT